LVKTVAGSQSDSAPADSPLAARRYECHVVRDQMVEPAERDVIDEQAMRIQVNGESVATLMRTPGHEAELATGFLLTEGLIHSPRQIAALSYCPDGSFGAAGLVRVVLTEELSEQVKRRHRNIFSSCSLCGTDVIEAFAEGLPTCRKSPRRLDRRNIFQLRDAMERGQVAFRRTGGTHAAALAELPRDATGERIVVREDLGRHNALDKAVGAAVAMGISLERSLLMLSGRLSVEMIAKAARAGITDLAGVSAPSALGVDLARRLGMFVAGFVRGDAMTVYSGASALQQS
jgi:FdhD protein